MVVCAVTSAPRLLLVTPWPPATAGGTQTLARGLARTLATDFGVEVTVATAAVPPEPASSSPWREVRLSWVSVPKPDGIPDSRQLVGDLFFPGLDRVIAETRPHAILYMPHNSACAHHTAKLARERGIPLWLWPLVHLDRRPHVNSSGRRLYRSAALVVAASEGERRWLLRRARVATENILLSGCGREEPEPYFPERPRHSAEVRLLTIGAWRAHKRLEDQLEALALLGRGRGPRYRLTAAGSGDASARSRLLDLACRLGVEDRIELVTGCSDAEIARLHGQSDFFLFTSASESLGVALFEAIAAGTFPVVYPHPVYRELVESSGFGVVARRATPRALAEALRAATIPVPDAVEQRRRRWLEEHAWPRVALPLADRLAGLSANARVPTPPSR